MNLTKFLPPKPTRVLDRDRLTTKLLAWEDKKLVVVHAQAGQGKSTLAAGYVKSLKTPTVWYNMDQEDENPALFLSTLGQAIQHTCTACLPKLPAVPQIRYGTGGIHDGLNRWIGQVFGVLPKTSLIVFDDFNNTPSSSALQTVLKTLIDATPPHIRFMILSRVQPELGIAKLRAAQSVGDLTNDDLKFTDAEVQDLFRIIFRMQISENEAALINSTAEGWPAGLVLMHDHLSSLTPGARALALTDKRAMGFRTHVFDYLAQEVFSHLPESMQRFLLRTSIADHLPTQLITILTGLSERRTGRKISIPDMVRDLRNRNLFVTTLDSDATVLRYHALFREFLRKKLIAQTRPTEVKTLYSRAAAYFERTGDRARSIDLMLASGQYDKAIKQICRCGEEMIGQGQTQTLVRWIESLPLEYGNNPWFLFYRALACRFSNPRTALTFFDLAFRGFRSRTSAHHGTAGQMLSLCGTIEACFHAGGDFKRMERAARLAQSLLEKTKKASPQTRGRLLLAIGMAWFFIGRLEQSATALRQALDLFHKQGDRFYEITSAIYLTPCALYQGNFSLAREALRKGFEASAAITDEAGGSAALFLTKAMAAVFEGKFDEAQECINQCNDLADVHALESIGFLSLDITGWLKIAQGEHDTAVRMLSECKRNGTEARNPFFTASASHFLAIAYLFQGSLEKAKTESDQAIAISSQLGSRLFHAIYLIVSGTINVKRNNLREAEQELSTAAADLRKCGAAQQAVNAHLALAQLYGKTGDSKKVDRHLHEAFSLAEDRGFTYFALLTREELRELAGTAIDRDICTGYCQELISGHWGTGAPLLTVHCMGGFKVFRNAKPIPDKQWKSKRARTLVKMLAAQDNLAMLREQAIEALWPDEDPTRLKITFNAMLHRARKVLQPVNGPGKDIFCIKNEGDVIALDREKVWTDVEQFLTHLENARRLKDSRKSDAALEEYDKAVSLYKGDFLPEDQYCDWTTATRDRLRLRYLKSLEDAAVIAQSSGDRGRALGFYERMFQADQSNEKACCWLMTQYASEGRRSEAVRTYERCERALSRDMDLEPEQQTKELYRSILGG